MPTSEDKLTEKQREVLNLVRRDPQPTPTQIAKELGITSQAVHGHFRRLRGHGLLPEEGTAPGRVAARERKDRRPTPGDALMAVQREIERQDAELAARQEQIVAEQAALSQESEQITATRKELRAMLGGEAAT